MNTKLSWANWTLSQKMRTDTYEISHYGDKNFHAVAPHCHDFCELYYFIGGRASYIIESKKYELRHGDLLLIPPGELHQLDIADSSQFYERIVLWITPRYLRALSSAETDLCECLRLCAQSRAYRLQDLSLVEKMGEWLCEVYSCASHAHYGDDLRSEILLKNIFLELCRYNRSRNEDGSGAVHEAVGRTIDYISAHLADNLSLDAIAEQMYLNKFYLSRLFREQTKMTLHQYILKKRLTLARSYLDQEIPVVELCPKCGFNDYTNFFRAFRNEYGMTPREYRARFRTNRL